MSLPDAGLAPMPSPDVDQPAPPRPPGPIAKAFDAVFRIAGGLVAVLATLATGVLEIFLAPLRVGGVLTGAAAVLAVVANVAISWFAVRTVGRRWAVGPPWAVWTLLMFFAVGTRTDEGDQLVSGENWVGLVMILLGSLAFASYAYRLILRGTPPR